ncbi:MAG: ABC transporter ATP-binding protein [Planctomycetota bacterium]|nr:MAG: ABC transporter ATP-binding protein [Planctomycetota bacterium]
MMRLEGVVRDYASGARRVRALAGIDLEIPRGQFAVLMGPSGSGKSTLLHVLGCLDVPTAGRYWLDGIEVTALPDAGLVAMRRHKLGMIFQAFHLVGRLTALRNVELPMVFAGLRPAERRRRARASLEAVGLGHRIEHRPDELSGGECQRVAIARALAMRPPVLLCDEPTGNLDSASGAEIMRLIDGLHDAGHTIVLVTHDPSLARVGNRLIRIRDGRIEADEPGDKR